MGFEQSWRITGATGNSSNHYGPRSSGQTVGVIKTESQKTELKFNVTAADVTAGGPPLVPLIIPAGSIILEVYTNTTTVWVTGNADNVVNIGTDGSELTNGVSIVAADLLNLGADSATVELNGTWDAEAALVAATTVGYSVTGTTAAATAGVTEVTIIYI